MRRKVLIFGLVMALMSISLAALADDGDDPEPEATVESTEATESVDYMTWQNNGRVVVDNDYTEFSIEFFFAEGAELPEDANHGTIVAAVVHLLKDPASWFLAAAAEGDDPTPIENFDVSQYRLGCLVSQVAKTGVGQDYDSTEGLGDVLSGLDLERCLKKQYNDEWEPPGKAKKGDGWVAPGQDRSEAAKNKAKGPDTDGD